MGDKSMLRGPGYYAVKDTDYTDPASFKAANQGTKLVYELATEELIDLGPADMPMLPETVSNVWAVSEPSTEVGVTYERDVTVAISNLEANIAALTVATS